MVLTALEDHKGLAGTALLQMDAAPMPASPAPTMMTSKCSGGAWRSVGLRSLIATSPEGAFRSAVTERPAACASGNSSDKQTV